MRRVWTLLLALGPSATPAAAQSPPADFATVELTRSRECVEVLERLDALDARLLPLAERSQRLLGIAEAIALEEPAVLETLDETDPLEARVKAWFDIDGELARRYLTGQDPAVLQERSAARDTIMAAVRATLASIKVRADSAIAATGSLQTRGGACSGAILVRAAVQEACGASTSRKSTP